MQRIEYEDIFRKEGADLRDSGGKDYKNLAPSDLSEKRLSTHEIAHPVTNPVFGNTAGEWVHATQNIKYS